jgi:excinuclease ABC subunit B
MFAAAENLEFEKAARLRDELRRLQDDGNGAAVEPRQALRKSEPPKGRKKTRGRTAARRSR